MPDEGNGHREQGRFEGKVLAKLSQAEMDSRDLWTRLNADRDTLRRELAELRDAIQNLNTTISFGKGAIASIAAVISIVMSILTTMVAKWLGGQK